MSDLNPLHPPVEVAAPRAGDVLPLPVAPAVEATAPPAIEEVSAADFAIEERLPTWQRDLLARAPESTPHTREGWRSALRALLAERI